jgi:hypothetical protein
MHSEVMDVKVIFIGNIGIMKNVSLTERDC